MLKALLISHQSRPGNKTVNPLHLVAPPTLPKHADPASKEAQLFGPLSRRREVNIRWRFFTEEVKKVAPPLEIKLKEITPSGEVMEKRNDRASLAALGISPIGFEDTSAFRDLEILAGANVQRPPRPRRERALSACSKALFAFARHESLWKNIYIESANGILSSWHGSWRKSYLARSVSVSKSIDWWTDKIQAPGLYSDVLYLPYLCTRTPIHDYFFPSGLRARSTIPRQPAATLTRAVFSESYALPSKPVIITSALGSWPSYSHSLWSLHNLKARFPSVLFRAEALDCTMETYASYANNCALEDSPLYLFDSRFVEKTDGEMGEEYTPPEIFGHDLFELMGEERPDYRWLVGGSLLLLDSSLIRVCPIDYRPRSFWVHIP